MTVYEDLLEMKPEDRKLWALEWMRDLARETRDARNNPRKAEALGRYLREHFDELVAAILVLTVDDEAFEYFVETKDVIATTLAGVAIQYGLALMNQMKR